jgi:hypothetical protein
MTQVDARNSYADRTRDVLCDRLTISATFKRVLQFDFASI